jgi:MEMO1 family protein
MDHPGRNSKLENRAPYFAGKFYPGTEPALRSLLKELFSNAKTLSGPDTRLRAIISPHAGYVFSGQVAASAFNQIPEGKTYKNIFVLASSHQFHFRGAAVFDSGNYETPLGEVLVNGKLSKSLTESNELFSYYPEAHEYEHSLEVQLPFLQYKLKNEFSLVPLVLGTQNPSDCKKMAKTLEPYFIPDNLFVISTDFSHYPDYEDAKIVDLLTANAICSNDPEQLLKVIEENKRKRIGHLATSLCGWTSVLTLLYLTKNKNLEYKKTEYRNSGDAGLYGDKERVVGYWALAVCEKVMPFQLTKEEQNELLDKARSAIVNFTTTGKRQTPEPPKTGGILQQPLGVFVSIYIRNELRGCIGSFAKESTLNDLAQHMAVSAACDYRFISPAPEELEDMEIEISVLSPLKKIHSIVEIKLGTHGIYIKKGADSGTFLPQVATKTGWNIEEFLGHCARDKAGLAWDGWKDADIYTYEAFVFRG